MWILSRHEQRKPGKLIPVVSCHALPLPSLEILRLSRIVVDREEERRAGVGCRGRSHPEIDHRSVVADRYYARATQSQGVPNHLRQSGIELELRHTPRAGRSRMFVPWLTLALTDGIGPILARRLIDNAGSAAEACEANTARLQTIEGIGTAKATKIATSLREAKAKVDDVITRAQAKNASIICPDDEVYPLLLKTIPDPPLVLFVRGELQPRDLNSVAIVGSRKCSIYGREQAERFAALLAGAGFTVISGGARGVDSAAHRGAGQHASGRTIAVLGSGGWMWLTRRRTRSYLTISSLAAA